MRTIVVGGQYGDEGKGKIVSYLAMKDNPEIVVRGGVGPNAGHQVRVNGKLYSLRLLPCGFVNSRARLLIGAGVLIDKDVLLKEMELTGAADRTGIDRNATLITPDHKIRDSDDHAKKIGTTGSGCGPAMSDRVTRVARTVAEEPTLERYLTDVWKEVNSKKNVLIEGSQGFMLSNVYGTYPFTTSKDTGASTTAADVGLGPRSIDRVVMVVKAYTTRIGAGPFPDEISMDEAKRLGYQEYGTVTGRARRTSAALHMEDLKRAAVINSATDIAITKLDVRFKGNEHVRSFEKLTDEAKDFVKMLEHQIGVPVTLIGTGPDLEDTIDLR